MKITKKHLLIIILAGLALFLGACSGQRIVASGWTGMTVDEDTVFFGYGQHTYALNLANGSQRWRFPAEPINGVDFFSSPVLVDGGSQLIVAGYDGVLYSLDPISGSKNWEFTGASNRYIAPPLGTDTGIYAASSDNTLYALDFNGLPLWQFTTDEPLWAAPAWSETCGCIYQASMDHHLYALDPESGDLVWETVDLGGPVVSQPAVTAEGLIVLSTFNNEVLALDGASQEVIWRFPTGDWAWASPVIDGDQVYASDIGGKIYALDLQTGDLLWQIEPGGRVFSSPLVKDDLIYFATDASSLVVVNRDGVVQRNTPFENGILYAGPAGAEGKILLGPSESEFYLIALNESGVQVWGFPPAK